MPPSHFNPRAPYGARLSLCLLNAAPLYFNPRAPYGARHALFAGAFKAHQFRSTRPIRGATAEYPSINALRIHFNPRAPYGARRQSLQQRNCGGLISIHAPHTGRDPTTTTTTTREIPRTKGFQSTRPIRGATQPSDRGNAPERHFNPRAPYGARLSWCSSVIVSAVFQSTRPIRGATGGRDQRKPPRGISIHAPHTGRDVFSS